MIWQPSNVEYSGVYRVRYVQYIPPTHKLYEPMAWICGVISTNNFLYIGTHSTCCTCELDE